MLSNVESVERQPIEDAILECCHLVDQVRETDPSGDLLLHSLDNPNSNTNKLEIPT